MTQYGREARHFEVLDESNYSTLYLTPSEVDVCGRRGVRKEPYQPNPLAYLMLKNEQEQLIAAHDRGVPGVIPVLDMGPEYTTTLYAEEGELAHREAPLTTEEAIGEWALLRSVAETLDALHRRGVVHRDISTRNMVIGERIYLIDFGLASAADELPFALNKGMVLGTKGTMSHERMMGQMGLTASDVFAFAASTYFHFFENYPWQKDSETIQDITPSDLRGRLQNEKPYPREFEDIIPPEVMEFILAGLDPKPEARPAMSEALGLR